MILKHEVSTDLSGFTMDDCLQLLTELTMALNNCSSVLTALKSFKDGEIDGEDLLDELAVGRVSGMPVLSRFVIGCNSRISAINRYSARLISRSIQGDDGVLTTKGFIDAYNEKIIRFVSTGAEPVGAELDQFIAQTSNLVGILAYLITYEFDLMSTAQSEDANTEVDVDVVLDTYVHKYHRDLKEYCDMVLAALAYNHPHIAVFDDYPELEQEFFNTVGPYLSDIDPDNLTYEIVQAVLSGELMPSDLNAIFNPDTSLSEETDTHKLTAFD